MSLRSIEGTPSEQFRSDVSHASSLEDAVVRRVLEEAMKFISTGQDLDRLIAALGEVSSEHGVNATLLKHSARGLVHISFAAAALEGLWSPHKFFHVFFTLFQPLTPCDYPFSHLVPEKTLSRVILSSLTKHCPCFDPCVTGFSKSHLCLEFRPSPACFLPANTCFRAVSSVN